MRLRLPALVALCLLAVLSLPAQTFTTLHNFTTTQPPNGTNRDGAFPQDQLVLSGNTLFGTASQGGFWANGTVFSLGASGTGFTNLHNFTAYTMNAAGFYTNADGVNPDASLVVAGNMLYGVAYNGGTNGNGTVFALDTNGTGFTVLHTFAASAYPPDSATLTNGDGFEPLQGMTLAGSDLYGTAIAGGLNGNGTIFRLGTNGTAFTNVYTFSASSLDLQTIQYTNGDGSEPNNVVLSGNMLFGTAYSGGTNDTGTIFALNTNGTGFAVLHTFSATADDANGDTTNSDGAFPQNGLLLAGNTLYGTAQLGGTNGNGTIFSLGTNGLGFTILYEFSAGTNNSQSVFTNQDGAGPFSALVLSGNMLYGTTSGGGSNGSGTVFALNTNGTGYSVLYTFSARAPDDLNEFTNSDGFDPNNGLILSGNTLYGMAAGGGTNGNGTVFSLPLTPARPQLILNRSGTNAVLSWPASFSGYTLSFATNLSLSPALWSTSLPSPVVVNERYVVTNGISAPRFYRLSQ